MEINTLVDQCVSLNKKINNWFLYEGGKAAIRKAKTKEKKDALNLTETREVFSLFNFDKLDPMNFMLAEQMVYLTLCIEWGSDSKILFDHKNKKAVCRNSDLGLLIELVA